MVLPYFFIYIGGGSVAVKSLAELKAQIENAIGDSLSGDVMEFIQQKLADHAKSDVYAVYDEPSYYSRRYSLEKKENMLIENPSNTRLAITPVSTFFPFYYKYGGIPIRSQNSGEELAGLVNYGDGWNGHHYDIPGSESYMGARPYITNTVEELESGELADSLWASLKNHGYNVR